MVSSKYHSISSLFHSRADPVAFRIVLKQDEGFDVHDTREFDLALDSKFAIGRASKNTSKGYLLPAKHNVYIDSPVVSREHAVLTANASTGTPRVFITDTKSMHGTYVNGTPLVPHTPKLLSNGDKLQFGVNVNRNESELHLHIHTHEPTNGSFAGYFVAYGYTFKAELSSPEPFSRGFTVPEAESEDEELDFVQSGRGSQFDPLVLDDSDAEPEHEAHDEHVEHSEDHNDVTMVQLEEEEERVIILESSEDEKAADSVADDIAESDIGSDAASTGSVHAYNPVSSLVHEAQFITEAEEQEVPAAQQVQATPVEQGQPSTTLPVPLDLPETERPPTESLYMDFGLPPLSTLPTLGLTFGSSPFENTFAPSHPQTSAPPLPPRPSEKRQRIWDEVPQEVQGWCAEESSTAITYSSAGLNDYTRLAHNMLVPPVEHVPVSLPAADRIQTPPPTMAADVVSSMSSPSTRRIGVSVTEIVDQQPPTPTSINSRKRSADDAFDEETEEVVEQNVTVPEVEGVAAAQSVSDVAAPQGDVIPTVEQVIPQPQRAIAQPRSILRRALRAAGLMGASTAFGAVVSIAALTTLPESFFTVA